MIAVDALQTRIRGTIDLGHHLRVSIYEIVWAIVTLALYILVRDHVRWVYFRD